MNPNTMMPDSAAGDSEHFNFAATLLECVACGVIVVSPAREIISFNDTAGKLLGLSGGDVLGRSASVLPPALQVVIEETFAKGRNVPRRNVDLAPADESGLLQIRTELARRNQSDVLSVLVELQNVRQAQEIAANLEHLDRLANLGVLGAGVAHEIKNALVAVRTFVDLLQERNKQDDLAQVVSREVQRIDAVVKQVLRGATREEFTLAPLSIHVLLNDSINLLRHQFNARAIQLDLQLDAAVDRINGDERQLRHAFLNLLINALEAVSGTGRITVATGNITEASRRRLRVTIADTGTGIRPEHLPRIFSPFFTTKKEGTGLGLAITRRIVQEHDGDVCLESQAEGGTQFTVSLPLI